jgi:hypothetical protein
MTARRNVTAAVLDALREELTERDDLLLRSVSELRFLSGDQLVRLYFNDSDDPVSNARAARRALLRLVRLGCLDRLPRRVGGVRSGSGGFVYHLGVAGQRLAMERGWQPMRRRRRSLVPGTLFLAHSLQVAELHTLLREADRSGRIELLELVAEPACWRSLAGNRGQAAMLKPDSFGEFGSGDFVDSYWFEVDMGTEGSTAIGRQLKRYLDYQASGQIQAERGVFPRVLWLAPSRERAAVIGECIGQLPKARREPFTAAPFADLITTLTNPGNNTHLTQVASQWE